MRWLIALLLLANLLFLALAQGWLQPLAGLSTQREPQRLAAQLHAEAVRVVEAPVPGPPPPTPSASPPPSSKKPGAAAAWKPSARRSPAATS